MHIPPWLWFSLCKPRVYPRECGGTPRSQSQSHHWSDLSPRVRGNRRQVAEADGDDGSIPASAGEPPAAGPVRSPAGVYPRECGGTSMIRRCRFSIRGLSPRVRGNLVEGAGDPGPERSIPASAGEPAATARRTGYLPVYPRECGGTWATKTTRPSGSGLSPRVRGNLKNVHQFSLAVWSIPASAGEPPKKR